MPRKKTTAKKVKKTSSKASAAKKSIRKSAKRNSAASDMPMMQLVQDFKEHTRMDDLRFGELKERFDKMNGSIPFIKDSISRIENIAVGMDAKIDSLHTYNAQQDKELADVKVQVEHNTTIAKWIEKVFIFTGIGSILSGLIYVVLKVAIGGI